MSTSSRIAAIQEFYTSRAETYDQSPIHKPLAEDLVTMANLKPGATVLDLCCGTGLVSIPAKSAVGPHGIVIGVDITPRFLDVARRKPESGDIRWVEHDVLDLGGVNGLEHDVADVIFCCSAFVLLPPPFEKALAAWAEYLKPGGLIIFDVPAVGTQIAGTILESVMIEFGVERFFDKHWITSPGSVRDVITAAGLEVVDVHVSRVYLTDEHTVGDGPRFWDRYTKTALLQPSLSKLSSQDMERAKAAFLDKWGKAGDQDGRIIDEMKFYICVAKRANQI
ncbi:hypothetical protein FRB96_004338 [Tulasnella sp. 330]|nr:hypothetical protein FRB96_004338 [Tulasnella sp. 330]KAG8874319.1 hypothetical protein FRB97_005987 [Tulasnella sp. 331]KAG8875494.1 hypothetical protein FRB98_007794 [Tulasnella sp. 332]